jgi:hypothetical protein
MSAMALGGVQLGLLWRHFHLDAFFKSKQVQGRVGVCAYCSLNTSLATFGQQTPPADNMAPNQPHVQLGLLWRHFHLDAFFKSKQVQGRVGGRACRSLNTSLATFGQQTPPADNMAPNQPHVGHGIRGCATGALVAAFSFGRVF